MGDQKERNSVTRRDVLKLAGTAAAFCTSFGFLHGSQTGGQVQDKHIVQDKHRQWAQAEIKWYAGSKLLHASAIPMIVLKHLESDANAVVELKLFRAGQLLRNLGAIQDKH